MFRHTDLLTQWEDARLSLSSGQRFCVKKPPVLDGTWEFSNIEVEDNRGVSRSITPSNLNFHLSYRNSLCS